jgi:hypothetical protein
MTTRLVPRGLAPPFLELTKFEGAITSITPSDGATMKTDVSISLSDKAEFTIDAKIKVLRVERCSECTVRALQGAVGSLELHRCRRVTLHVLEPISSIRLDDCEDVRIILSWRARFGYADDSRPGNGALPASAGVGLQVLTTGSHAVTLVYPTAADDDAPVRETLLPEILVHSLTAESGDATGRGAVQTRHLSHGSWT